jgi:hypothetical protein
MGAEILIASNLCTSVTLKTKTRESAKYLSGSSRRRVSVDPQTIKILYGRNSDNYHVGTEQLHISSEQGHDC